MGPVYDPMKRLKGRQAKPLTVLWKQLMALHDAWKSMSVGKAQVHLSIKHLLCLHSLIARMTSAKPKAMAE